MVGYRVGGSPEVRARVLRSILPAMRLRSGASVVFAVLGMPVLLVGTVAFYARQEVVNREAFADRALAALEDDGVRVVVRDEIVDGLIDRGSGDLVAARPLLESIVDVVIDSEPFRAIFRRAALEANRVFFVREKENALVDISDAAMLVELAMRSVSPKVAAEIPDDFDSQLAALRRRDFAGQSLAVAEDCSCASAVKRLYPRRSSSAANPPANGANGPATRTRPVLPITATFRQITRSDERTTPQPAAVMPSRSTPRPR
jgi:hypothetical protein